METVLKEGVVVLLEDKNFYSIVKIFEYKGCNYLYLIKTTNFDANNPVLLLAKENIEGTKLSLEIVEDTNLIYELSDELKKIYNQ